MAKTLYFTDFIATSHRGDNSAKLAGGASFWAPYVLSEGRGDSAAGLVSASIPVTGPTGGIEVGTGVGALSEWLSEPLSADFTVAGTITANLWGYETDMNGNAAINVAVDKVDAITGALTRIATSARVTELALTTSAVNNFTVTPTSTACKRGDRIRVRVFFDDVGTMGAFGNVAFALDRSSAGATGDSYITFTENLTFEASGDPGAAVADFPNEGGFANPGTNNPIATYGVGQPFIAKGTLTEVQVKLSKNATPTSDLVIEIQTDNAGSPSGTVVATIATVPQSALSTTQATYTYACNVALSVGITYHLVLRTSVSSANYYRVAIASPNALSEAGGYRVSTSYAGTWGSALTTSISHRLAYPYPVSTYYLTDTASEVNNTFDTFNVLEKKALTTRGTGGTKTSVTNTTTGPTSGIWITDAGGGTWVEWYTPPLEAVTLAGKSKFNIRALASGLYASGLRAEIAVVNGDGSGAVVWGTACQDPNVTGIGGYLATTEASQFLWVAGDDVAVTAGKRLRFRLYHDDAAGYTALSGYTLTVSYNGTTANAAGDSYVILPVAVVEQITGPTNQTQAVTGLASPQSFGAITTGKGPVSVQAPGVPPVGIFGVPTTKIVTTVPVTGVGSAQSFGTPVIKTTITKPTGGVSSAQSFGVPVIARGAVSRAVTGIGSAQSFGTPVPKAVISKPAGGVPTAQSFGVPVPKAVISKPLGGVSSSQSFGTPTTAKGFVTATVESVASAQSFGTVLANAGGIPGQLVPVPGLDPDVGFDPHIVGEFLAGQAPVGYTAAAAPPRFGTPTFTISSPAVNIFPAGVTSAQSFGAATPKATFTRTVTGLGSAQSFGTVTPKTVVNRAVTGLGSAQQFGTVSTSAVAPPQTKTVTGLGSAQSFGAPVPKSVIVRPVGGVSSAQAFAAPLAVPRTTVPVAGKTSAQAFGAPQVAGGSVPQTVAVPGVPPSTVQGRIFNIVGQSLVGQKAVGYAPGGQTQFGYPFFQTRVTVQVAGLGSAQAFGAVHIRFPQRVLVGGISPGYLLHICGMYLCGQALCGYEGSGLFGKPRVVILGVRPSPPEGLILYPTTPGDSALVPSVPEDDPWILIPTTPASVTLTPTDEADEEEGEWIIRPTTEVPM